LGGKILSASIDADNVEVPLTDGEMGSVFGTGSLEGCNVLENMF